jgi:hypothetical protein
VVKLDLVCVCEFSKSLERAAKHSSLSFAHNTKGHLYSTVYLEETSFLVIKKIDRTIVQHLDFMIFTNDPGPVKRGRQDFNADVVSQNFKKIRISSNKEGNQEEDDYNGDADFPSASPLVTSPRRRGLDPMYFSIKKKAGRHVDYLEDDLIRKSRRRSWEQNSVASGVPPSDFALSIPSSIGPHPTTDMHYLSSVSSSSSRSPPSRNDGHAYFSRQQQQQYPHPPLVSSHLTSSSDNTGVTHSEWFALGSGSGGSEDLNSTYGLHGHHQDSYQQDGGHSSDDCEDMLVTDGR